MTTTHNSYRKRAIKIEESCRLPDEFKAMIRLLARNAALEFLDIYRHNKHNQ